MSRWERTTYRCKKRIRPVEIVGLSYVFSKIITDADSYWRNATTSGGNGCCLAADQYHRRLEKSIGQFDVTHSFKAGFVYDLPFGKGRAYLTHGVGSWLLGNWGINGFLFYSSGQPVGITSSYILPLYGNSNGRSTPYITSYTGWQPNFGGSFDPTTENFFVPYKSGPFPSQGSGTDLNSFGNNTRYNPKVRQFPNYNENLSVARAFPIRESMRIEFRAEAFKVFNRVRFGTGSLSMQDQNFGHLTSSADQLNTRRQLQLALKLYF